MMVVPFKSGVGRRVFFFFQQHHPVTQVNFQSVQFKTAVYRPEDLPDDRFPQIAMAGRSNVGKSTLINRIVNRRGVARVSQTPGKTRAIQFYLVDDSFYLVDLPGYGYAKVSKTERESWGGLVRSYLESNSPIELFMFLIDVRRDPTDEDLEMRDWLVARSQQWRIIATKTDKLSNNQRISRVGRLSKSLGVPKDHVIAFSSIDKRGTDEVRGAIVRAVKESRVQAVSN